MKVPGDGGGGSMVAERVSSVDRVAVLICSTDPWHAGSPASCGVVSSSRLGTSRPETVALVVVDQVDGECATMRSLHSRGAQRSCCSCHASTRRACCPPSRRGDRHHAPGGGDPGQPDGGDPRRRGREGSLPDLPAACCRRSAGCSATCSIHGLTFAGLTDREVSVLRLLADGFRHGRGGRHLFYPNGPSRTSSDITSRLRCATARTPSPTRSGKSDLRRKARSEAAGGRPGTGARGPVHGDARSRADAFDGLPVAGAGPRFGTPA
jgi:hypothetical protein